ncbi:MAG TPA: cyclic nucleotide-binding domain-containing protein [Chloroflexota bacterium]
MASPVLETASVLRSSVLFAPFSNEEIGSIAACVRLEHFDAGQIVVREGEPGDACYIVKSGDAAVISQDLIGQEITLAVLQPAASFGEIALLTNQPRTATIRAQTDLETFVLDRADFERLAREDASFGKRVREQVELLLVEAFLKKSSPFAQLAPDAVQRLVRDMRPQSVAAGEVVIREGDAAERFYVIRSGRVEVLEGTRRVRTMETGECFGEVGLMAERRRTATVRAITETELLTLDRPAFDHLLREQPSLRNRLAEFVHIRYRAAPGQSLALPDPISTLMPFVEAQQRARYWLLLLLGTGLFAVFSVLAAVVGGSTLVFAALLVGSFVSPLVYVTYLVESGALAERPFTILIAFALGAGLGLPLAIRLEQATGAQAGALLPALLVAIAEESAKLFSVVWLLRRRTARFQMDGTIYGAAVGMGFAAFETVLFGIGQIDQVRSVGPLLVMLWLRALLAPFGHGTWTAIVGSVLWRKRTRTARDWVIQLTGAFLLAITLHTMWDWQPLPGILNVLLFLGIAVIGILVLRALIQRATTEQLNAILALNPEVAGAQGGLRAVRCRQCGLTGLPGSHYCTRCGAVLRL